MLAGFAQEEIEAKSLFRGEADESCDIDKFFFQDGLAETLAASLFGVIGGGLQTNFAKKSFDNGAAPLGINFWAIGVEKFAIGCITMLLVHQKSLYCFHEGENLHLEGVLEEDEMFFYVTIIDSSMIRIELSVNFPIFALPEDSRGVYTIVFGVAFPGTGPNFVQRAKIGVLRERDASDDEVPHAVFTALFVVQVLGHFLCNFCKVAHVFPSLC